MPHFPDHRICITRYAVMHQNSPECQRNRKVSLIAVNTTPSRKNIFGLLSIYKYNLLWERENNVCAVVRLMNKANRWYAAIWTICAQDQGKQFNQEWGWPFWVAFLDINRRSRGQANPTILEVEAILCPLILYCCYYSVDFCTPPET